MPSEDAKTLTLAPPAVKTILVIDDDIPTIELLTAALSLEGYRVLEAVNGRQGIERLINDRPDLVLCDVLMPVLDGRAVAEVMRTDPAFQDIPLVLISAGQETRVAKGVACAAFVEKPFSLQSLVELLEKLLKQP